MTNNLTKLLTFSDSSVLKNQSKEFSFNKQNQPNRSGALVKRITLFLKAYFALLFCLMSKPVFRFSQNKVTIHIFYYKPKIKTRRLRRLFKSFWYKWYNVGSPDKRRSPRALNSDNGRKLVFLKSRFKYLAYFLASILEINVELEIVRLKYPYHDSEILAQLLGKNGERRRANYHRIKKILFRKATILGRKKHLFQVKLRKIALAANPNNLSTRRVLVSRLTGIRFRIGGRLPRQRIVPKRTVKSAYKGGISKSVVNNVSTSSYTTRNRRGIVNIKVWLSHGF